MSARMKRVKCFIKECITEKVCSSPAEIIKKIDQSEVVSFDIFDTLVERKCGKPEAIFDVLEMESGIPGFKLQRIRAEHEARKKRKPKEVSMKQIYRCIENLDHETKKKIMQLECKTELKNCVRKDAGYRLYQETVRKDKTILITSDMYLPKKLIEMILEQCGYSYERLYLSSEEGDMKHYGRLFDRIKKDYYGRKVLHIGDNVRGDYFMPMSYGISAALIGQSPDL